VLILPYFITLGEMQGAAFGQGGDKIMHKLSASTSHLKNHL